MIADRRRELADEIYGCPYSQLTTAEMTGISRIIEQEQSS